MRPRLKISQRSYPKLEEPVPIAIDEILNHSIEEEMMIKQDKKPTEENILNEPMVAKALELFAPKKVRVKRSS
jgi:hypothetical protein